MKPPQIFPFLLTVAGGVVADNTEFANDPYLAYRPAFARSLPIQIMLTGVVLTLVAVLFIHLMFTAQYHWPLAPVNYVLQLSGVTTLLISLIATIHVVLSATFAESEKWPYMLSYIAVNVPPLDITTNTEGWSIAERATWLVMNASTSGLIQITHIQFLTLLYPSRLEGRLIFTLLGPLAVVAAIMQLLPINGNANVMTVASAVRNVCNATLSLLFTVALFMWGLLVNRKQAWRTDGGTAVFGCAALSLAVVSTALNFLYVHKEEEFMWLPGLMWAVVLWQSFLGWWWWVGAGSGAGLAHSEDESMEEKLRREAKRERRRKEARERRKETKIKAQKVWKGVAGAFVPSSHTHSTAAEVEMPLQPIDTTRDASAAAEISRNEEDEPSEISAGQRHRRRRSSRRDHEVETASLASRATSMTLTSTSQSELTRGTLPTILPTVVHRWYASLRKAHNAAARLQAAERVERIRELGIGQEAAGDDVRGISREMERQRQQQEAEGWRWGWGWGGLGWTSHLGHHSTNRSRARRAERSTMRDKEKDLSPSRSRSRSRRRRNVDEADEAGYEMDNIQSRRSRRSRRDGGDEAEEEEEDVGEEVDDIYVEDAEEGRRRHRRNDDGPSPASAPPDPILSIPATTTNSPTTPAAAALDSARPRSLWWWGPLRRWRLQDSTVY